MGSRVTSFRIKDETRIKLDILSKITNKKKTELLEEAICLLVEKYKDIGYKIPEKILKDSENKIKILFEDASLDAEDIIKKKIKRVLLEAFGLFKAGILKGEDKDGNLIIKDKFYKRKFNSEIKELVELLREWDKIRGPTIYAFIRAVLASLRFCSPSIFLGNFRDILFIDEGEWELLDPIRKSIEPSNEEIEELLGDNEEVLSGYFPRKRYDIERLYRECPEIKKLIQNKELKILETLIQYVISNVDSLLDENTDIRTFAKNFLDLIK